MREVDILYKIIQRLAKYLRHKDYCSKTWPKHEWDGDTNPSCTCGLDELRREIGE